VYVDSFKWIYGRFLGNLQVRLKGKWAMKISSILYCLKRTNHQRQAKNIGMLLMFGLIPFKNQSMLHLQCTTVFMFIELPIMSAYASLTML